MPHTLLTCFLKKLTVCMVFLSLLFLTVMFVLRVIFDELSGRGIVLKFSTAYHPHTDGQTKVVNQSHGDLLRCLVGEHLIT